MVAVGLILYGKVIEKHRPSVRILDESHLTVGVRHHDYIGAAHLGPLHKHPEGIHITFRIKGPHIDFGTVPVAVFPDSHQEAAQKLLIKPGRTPRMFIFGHKRKHHCHTHLMGERNIRPVRCWRWNPPAYLRQQSEAKHCVRYHFSLR